MRTSFYTADKQNEFTTNLLAHYNGETTLTNKQVLDFATANKYPYPNFLLQPKNKISHGKYLVPTSGAKVAAPQPQIAEAALSAKVVPMTSRRVAANATESFIPEKNPTYVSFGFHTDLKNIISSKIFYPIYITGLSGNGKTFMVEQVCASLKRELIRVNITKETDESDLIGSYELIDGNTVRREGPVVTAMRRGAVLLLDETDYGSERLLCLQPVLEGKPYFDKKTGEVIHPAQGFNVIATANTKGKGSDDGRFVGANTLNEAFLERFAITVEQEYPPAATEKRIVLKNFEELGINDVEFADRLTLWADAIRKSFSDGAVDEIVSTRRLVHIAKAYSIFKGNRLKAIEMCMNRFDTDTKNAFIDLYTKVDKDATTQVVAEAQAPHPQDEDIPF